MPFQLTVATSMDSLVDALAEELSRPAEDPFSPELIVVPAAGMRSWLSTRLAERLGRSAPDRTDGVIANVEFMYPASFIRRAIGADPTTADPWSVGSLTWAIHAIAAQRADGTEFDADLLRCRMVADLFDRYALHRPELLRRWERGLDHDAAGQPLAASQQWQPRLWRSLIDWLGRPSGPARLADAAARIRVGRHVPDLPERVAILGLVSLPPPHLAVVAALGAQHSMQVYAPIWSAPVWEQIEDIVRRESETPARERAADPTASLVQHPLARSWGAGAREAQVLLARTAREVGCRVQILGDPPENAAPPGERAPNLLDLLHDALRADRAADRAAERAAEPDTSDGRPLLSPDDRSLRWHRCHGDARQVEVLRDVIAHLLEDRSGSMSPPLEPRDIQVVTPDPNRFASLVRAVFAGDPEHGVPTVPLQVADRSLRRDTPLLDSAAALLGMLDGRCRSSDVLAFASTAPVAQRFNWDAEMLGLLGEWAAETHVRWGLRPADRVAFGVPEAVAAHTWRHGLEQLVTGAALADPELAPAGLATGWGLGGVVPADGIEGAVLECVGSLASFLDRLAAALDALRRPALVPQWCAAFSDAMRALCEVADDDTWQWRRFDAVLDELIAEASAAGVVDDTGVPDAGRVAALPDPMELALMVSTRLEGQPAPVRFGTGAVTLSSLTAVRGVPARVVCVLGLDADSGAVATRAEDLLAAVPFIGDRDPRGELRSQLFDAVLAARDSVVILSNGFDLRTNASLSPSVPLAELLDVIDLTVQPPLGSRRASDAIAIDHPRHAWSDQNFRPGALDRDGPWSFDRNALAAARRRDVEFANSSNMLDLELPAKASEVVELHALERCIRNPIRTICADRLGISILDEQDSIDDLVPVSLDALDRYHLRADLIGSQLRAGATWDAAAEARWCDRQRRSGRIPPLSLGDAVLESAQREAAALIAEFRDRCGSVADQTPVGLDVQLSVSDRVLRGVIADIRGDVHVELLAGSVRPHHRLIAWCRLLVLSLAQPERDWSVVVIGRGDRNAVTTEVLRSVDRSTSWEAIEILVDYLDRARRMIVPAMPATTRGFLDGGLRGARQVWEGRIAADGENPWVRFALGDLDLEQLLELSPRADEIGSGWYPGRSRLEIWAHRIWDAFDASTIRSDDAAVGAGAEAEG